MEMLWLELWPRKISKHMDNNIGPSEAQKRLQQYAVLHQYQILNWKNVCVSLRGPDRRGYLINWPPWWLMVRGERSEGKLCHTVSISGCLPRMHSNTSKKCAVRTLDMFFFAMNPVQWFHNSRSGQRTCTNHCVHSQGQTYSIYLKTWSKHRNSPSHKPKQYIIYCLMACILGQGSMF